MATVTKPIALDETLQSTNTALGTQNGKLDDIKTAIQGIGLANIGNLASLNTTDKSSLVGAVNELVGDFGDLDTDKADKVSSATNGNLAGLDGNGNLTDSGWSGDKTTTNATGNPISITGLKSNQLAKNPIITFEPIETGTGTKSPSNPWTISGYDKIEVLLGGKQEMYRGNRNSAGAKSSATTRLTTSNFFRIRKDARYRITVSRTDSTQSGKVLDIAYNIWQNDSETNNTRVYDSGWLGVTETIMTYNSDVWMTVTVRYTNDATITITEAELVIADKTTDISESLGQTVYGMFYYPRTGEAIITWGYIASYAGETLPSEWISDRDEYVSGTTPTTGAEVAYKLASANYTTIQLTPHEISLLKDYAYLSTNGSLITLAYHNGELASLADVSQLGETVNELGDYVGRNEYFTTVGLNDRVGSNNKYEFPYDGYIYISSETVTTGSIKVIITAHNTTQNIAYLFMNITSAYERQSLFVKKGMGLYLQAAIPSGTRVRYIPFM